MILAICVFLKSISDNVILYGYLRIENILLKLKSDQTKIENIKFFNLSSLATIKNSEQIHIPNQIDHLPFDFFTYLIQYMRFVKIQ